VLHADFLPAYSLTLKMDVTCSSEMSVDIQQTTWCYIPEGRTFHVLISLQLKGASSTGKNGGTNVYQLKDTSLKGIKFLQTHSFLDFASSVLALLMKSHRMRHMHFWPMLM
jgi:hypothetical protein